MMVKRVKNSLQNDIAALVQTDTHKAENSSCEWSLASLSQYAIDRKFSSLSHLIALKGRIGDFGEASNSKRALNA